MSLWIWGIPCLCSLDLLENEMELTNHLKQMLLLGCDWYAVIIFPNRDEGSWKTMKDPSTTAHSLLDAVQVCHLLISQLNQGVKRSLQGFYLTGRSQGIPSNCMNISANPWLMSWQNNSRNTKRPSHREVGWSKRSKLGLGSLSCRGPNLKRVCTVRTLNLKLDFACILSKIATIHSPPYPNSHPPSITDQSRLPKMDPMADYVPSTTTGSHFFMTNSIPLRTTMLNLLLVVGYSICQPTCHTVNHNTDISTLFSWQHWCLRYFWIHLKRLRTASCSRCLCSYCCLCHLHVKRPLAGMYCNVL